MILNLKLEDSIMKDLSIQNINQVYPEDKDGTNKKMMIIKKEYRKKVKMNSEREEMEDKASYKTEIKTKEAKLTVNKIEMVQDKEYKENKEMSDKMAING